MGYEFEDDDDFEDEEEDEEEDDDEEDEFDDEFEDEFADDIEDELAAFGPMFVQGQASINFEQYAIMFSFGILALSLFMLYQMVFTEVYGTAAPNTIDGLGREVKKDTAGEQITSFAPASVPVLGVGKYDAMSPTFDYAILGAGADQGLGVGLLYALIDESEKKTYLVICKVNKDTARAEFVEFVDGKKPADIVKDEAAGPSPTKVYTDYGDTLTADGQDKAYEQITAEQDTVMPVTPPMSPQFHLSLVREAYDSSKVERFKGLKWDYNPQWNVLMPAPLSDSDATKFAGGSKEGFIETAGDVKDGVPSLTFRYFRLAPPATVLPANEQALIAPIVSQMLKAGLPGQ